MKEEHPKIYNLGSDFNLGFSCAWPAMARLFGRDG